MTEEKRKCDGLDEKEIEAWLEGLGSFPVERIAYDDRSRYEVERAHVLRLENGQYALVTERVCSCHDLSEAEIELFKEKHYALEAFRMWKEE